MKNIAVFLLSVLVTMCIIVGVMKIIDWVNTPKAQYSVSSYISIQNNKDIITDEKINYDECIDADGNFKLKIGVGSNEQRPIQFEISFLLNYTQKEFRIDNQLDKVKSYKIDINKNKKEFYVFIDKKEIMNYENDFIIVLKQDSNVFSCDNELIRETNTVFRRYNLINTNIDNKCETENRIEQKKISQVANNETSDELMCSLQCVNREESACISTAKRRKISFQLKVGGSKISEHYIVLAYLNSKQAEINGKDYLGVIVDRGRIGEDIIDIIAPDKIGKYELEVFCISSPYECISAKDITQYNISSAQRYTIRVEE